jgi:hypothetical protein
MANRLGIFGIASLALLAGCSDYGLTEVPEDLPLTEFVDCTSVIGDRYWYQEHEFGVVMIYDGCTPSEYNAYLLIEHEYELMDQAWTTAEYTTDNDDVVTVDAVYYSLDFWYNPVDIEMTVVPFAGDIALGIHEFWVDCTDDDEPVCDIDYLQGVSADDLE